MFGVTQCGSSVFGFAFAHCSAAGNVGPAEGCTENKDTPVRYNSLSTTRALSRVLKEAKITAIQYQKAKAAACIERWKTYINTHTYVWGVHS